MDLWTWEGHTFPGTSWKRGHEGENSLCQSMGSAQIQHRPKMPMKRWISFPWNQQFQEQFPKSSVWMLCPMGRGQGCPGSAGGGPSSASRAAKLWDLQAIPSPGCLCPKPHGILQEEKGLQAGSGVGERQNREGNAQDCRKSHWKMWELN